MLKRSPLYFFFLMGIFKIKLPFNVAFYSLVVVQSKKWGDLWGYKGKNVTDVWAKAQSHAFERD